VKTERLCGVDKTEDDCDDLFSYVPLVLIFLSQFVLGVGNTLYYSLGQTYLDDNTKKTNTPLMLAVALYKNLVIIVIWPIRRDGGHRYAVNIAVYKSYPRPYRYRIFGIFGKGTPVYLIASA